MCFTILASALTYLCGTKWQHTHSHTMNASRHLPSLSGLSLRLLLFRLLLLQQQLLRQIDSRFFMVLFKVCLFFDLLLPHTFSLSLSVASLAHLLSLLLGILLESGWCTSLFVHFFSFCLYTTCVIRLIYSPSLPYSFFFPIYLYSYFLLAFC